MALIEVGPNRYHYVVIVAWTGEQVIVHDPARAPFRVMSRAEFEGGWAPAGRWALLILPPENRPPGVQAPPETTTLDTPLPPDECGALVEQMVQLARTGDVGTADTGLLVVDLVRVEGARRTRYPVVAPLVDLSPRSLHTTETRGRAARRLGEHGGRPVRAWPSRWPCRWPSGYQE